MLILSPVDPISSVVSAGHTLGLRGGSDTDRSRRITIFDVISQGRSWVEPRTITFVCSVSYRESRARERSCREGKKHYPRRLQHFGFYLAEAASLDLLDSWGSWRRRCIRVLSGRDPPPATASCLFGCGTGRVLPLAEVPDAYRPAGGCDRSRARSAAGIPGRAIRGFSCARNRCPAFRRPSFYRLSRQRHMPQSPSATACLSDSVSAPWRSTRK